MQNQKNTINPQKKAKNLYDFSNLSIPLDSKIWQKYLQQFWENKQSLSFQKEQLTKLIVEISNVTPNNFLVFNTPLESILFTYQMLKPKKVKLITPYLSFFEKFTKQLKIKAIYSGFFSFQHVEDWVLLSNPNPFTGSVTYLDELEEILEKNHKTHFFIDETWMPFTNQTSTAASLVKHFSNLFVIKSFTEIWGDVKIQASILFGSAQTIRVFQSMYDNQAFQPILWYSLYFLLKEIQIPKDELLQSKTELIKEISQIPSFQVQNTFTHFFNLKKQGLLAKDFQNKLLEKNISVFFEENKKGLLPDFVRVTSRSEKENKILLDALKSV